MEKLRGVRLTSGDFSTRIASDVNEIRPIALSIYLFVDRKIELSNITHRGLVAVEEFLQVGEYNIFNRSTYPAKHSLAYRVSN